MVTNRDPVRLLIAADTENRAEELINQLRGAGFVTRARFVPDTDGLLAALDVAKHDVLVCIEEAAGDQDEMLGALAGTDEPIPALLIAADREVESLTRGIRAGATDVVLDDEDERLLHVLQRELDTVNERRRRRRAEAAVAEAETRNRILLETSRAAIAYVHEGMHIFANQSWVDLFGFDDADDLAGLPLLDLIAPESVDDIRRRLKEFATAGGGEPFEFHGRPTGGEPFSGEMSLSSAEYDGEPCIQVLIRVRRASEEAPRPAHDLVTGLTDRANFESLLGEAVNAVRRESGRASVLFAALDGFTEVKAAIGIANADLVLTDIATALRNAAPDEVELARFSDDAFVALVRDAGREQAEALAERLRSAVEDLLSEVGGRTIQLTASLGVAHATGSTEGQEELLSDALKSATRGAQAGGNRVTVHDPAIARREAAAASGADARLIELIERNLADNSFVLLFQPIISLRGDNDEHYEVFIRLVADDGSYIGPDEFLQTAVESGLGGRLDRWLILHAIKILSLHRSKGHDTRLTINLTRDSFTDPGFISWLAVAIKAARMPSDAVIFQITEPDATGNLKPARDFINGLREMHCRASLSHFGGSVNPFGTLRHLPVDFVKVDGSYVLELQSGNQEQLANLISSLQSQGKLTIVPMVESAAVLSRLWQAGANYIQGHYLQEPSTQMDYDFSSED